MNKNITATILIVLAIGIYFTVTEKVIADGKAIQKVNDEYVSAIESAKKLIAVRDQVTRDYNNISEIDRERLSKMIPNSVDNIRLIIDLNDVARRHGFQLEGIKAVASTDSANNTAPAFNQVPGMPGVPSRVSIAEPILDNVTVTFSVTAPYLQFKSFLQEIEANLRLMEITKLSMTANDTGIYTYKVELKTYWLRQQ